MYNDLSIQTNYCYFWLDISQQLKKMTMSLFIKPVMLTSLILIYVVMDNIVHTYRHSRWALVLLYLKEFIICHQIVISILINRNQVGIFTRQTDSNSWRKDKVAVVCKYIIEWFYWEGSNRGFSIGHMYNTCLGWLWVLFKCWQQWWSYCMS